VECWYLTPEDAFYGDAGSPHGRLPDHGGYAFEVTGATSRLASQISGTLRDVSDNAVPRTSVQVMLAAVEAACTSERGILIDDSAPTYKPIEGNMA